MNVNLYSIAGLLHRAWKEKASSDFKKKKTNIVSFSVSSSSCLVLLFFNVSSLDYALQDSECPLALLGKCRYIHSCVCRIQ